MDTRELRQQRGALLKQARAILDAAKKQKRGLSTTEQTQYDNLLARANGLREEIRAQEHGAVAGTLGGGFIEPEQDETRATSTRGSYLQPEYVPTPEQRQYRQAFNSFLRFGAHDMPSEHRAVLRRETRDMGSGGQSNYPGATAGGAFFVPTGFVYEVERALKYYGPMLNEAKIMPTDTGAVLPWPTANDTAVVGELIGEGQQVTTNDVTLGSINFTAFKFSTKMVKISIELMQDSAFDLERFLIEEFAIRLGRILNQYFTNGSGTSQPNGIITAAIAGGRSVVAKGSSLNDGTSAGGNTIGSDDLVSLEHSVDPLYRPGSKWMMHDSTLRFLKTVKDKFGHPLWMESTRDGQPQTILGYEFAINNDMAALQTSASSPTVSVNSVLFGPLKKYVIRMVREMSVLRLTERFSDYGQVGFIGFLRCDGQLLDAGTRPLALLQNTY